MQEQEAGGGHITRYELPYHLQAMHYAMQNEAWFDEVTMLD
jgi:hypothetical protein